MTWARLDDGFWRNEKAAACSDASLGLYVRAISYCADQRTDGKLSRAALGLIKAKAARLAELVTTGLFEDNGDGSYAVHDFLIYNPSAEQLDSKHHAKSIAGAKAAASRWHNTGNAPVPDPTRPVPDPPPAPPDPLVLPVVAEPLIKRAVSAWECQAPMGITPWISDRLIELLADGCPIEWIEAACEAAAEAGGRKPWSYVSRILTRYREQGNTADTRKPAMSAGATESPLILNGRAVTNGLDMPTEADLEYDRQWKAAQRG